MRSKVVRPLLVAAGVFAMVAGAVLPAAALDFAFKQTSGFDNGSHTVTGGTGGVEFFGPVVVPTFDPYTDIGWGCAPEACTNPTGPNGSIAASSPFDGPNAPDRSAMRVVGDTGSVTVGGPFVRISRIFHKNTTIDSEASALTGATIASLLQITDSIPPFDDDPNGVAISFTETANVGDGSVSPCTAPNPGGSACDDLFALLDPSQVFDAVFFTSGGQQYRIDFTLDIPEFLTLDGVTPNGAFLVDGIFYTREGEISELHVLMAITEIVPAPATLLLLGLGLVGASLTGWRRFIA